ncbi:hypothetical protein [Chitinophaga sp.]|uniref:hypothetical protein n=1 Tax=Chitinophaga sp. TaxID=1869181 RepID=UPI0031DB7550
MGQTSWIGGVSTAWNNSANWTAGVPTATVDAVIGDANFTGPFHPNISTSSVCHSLTISSNNSPVLSISKGLTIAGDLNLNAGGTISQKGVTVTIKGNWNNSGTYTTTSTNSKVTFGGTTQSINGNATTFRRLTINAGSTVTLNVNTSVSGAMSVSGTFLPAENATPEVVSGSGTLSVGATGILKVNASTFAGNYGLSSISLSAGSTVDYSATLVNQTIRETLTYSTLTISGSGTKTPAGNLNALNSTTSTAGIINVKTGTLDLSTFTANRGTSVAGGSILVANGATLKLGGTTTFPANYSTVSLSLTSTVEYSGTNQTVAAATYGNLTLSASSGTIVKTMPATDFIVAGNFVSNINAGTSLTFTGASNITFSGNVTIGASTTFNGSTFNYNLGGNWINNGTFTGNTSTVLMNAPGSSISGSGTQNFNNLTIGASNITAPATTTINLSGNLATTGPGEFTCASGNTFTMSGTSKTITGTNIVFDNLTVSGSVTASNDLTITGNLSVSGTLTGSGNTITLSGASKTISGAGTVNFNSLVASGSITTAINFSIGSSLYVSGTLTASAGTATFTGTSSLTGTANLFNVNLNGTSLQLSTNAVLGIANTYTVTSGTLNVTSTAPNTVNYNGSGAQTVTASTYGNLTLSNGSTKTAGGNISVNGDLTIATSTTFSGSTATVTVMGNWYNNGTFTASSSTVAFTGSADATINGATTFNILTLNKSATTNQLTLNANTTVGTLNMTQGGMSTGSNMVIITTTRTGPGIIIGTIRRQHAFSLLTPYTFEGPDNQITFTGITLAVTAITVTVTKGAVTDFPSGSAINREYTITVTGTNISIATLRLHYEDAELNGNTESALTLWHNTGSGWSSSGSSSNSTTSNYVEQILLGDVTNRWTLSSTLNVARWNGSVSSNWATAGNWTTVTGSPSTPPGVNDIAEIGTAAFTNQPVITSAASVKSIQFGSVQAATLTLNAGGSLTTAGNISGTWSTNATHTINANNQNITVNGDLSLSDGTSGDVINLNAGTGTITVGGSLTESGGANVTFSGAGNLNIGNNFNYTNGTFTPSTSTVTYNGTNAQIVAGVPYYNLTINTTGGIATLGSATSVAGNLSVSAGELDISGATNITGDVTIASGAILNGGTVTNTVGGNWNNSGTFVPSGGTITFNGSGAQSISASSFNNLIINKAGGTATLSGNVSINSDLTLSSGTLSLSTFTCNRSSSGGTCTLTNGTTLLAGGTNNFPANFVTYASGTSSTVNYNGTVAQRVAPVTYGNLIFTNGGTKTLNGNAIVNGDLTINSGATFSGSSYSITLGGNWVNSGTYTPASSTVILNGSGKTITGTTTFNKVTVYGSYTVAGSDQSYNGLLFITATGTYNAGSGSATVNGDLTNSGVLTSTGTTTFTGTVVQTIRLLNAITSNSSGVINFNGSISPVLNSTSTPTFATLNVNNTAGVNPSVGWTVVIAFNVGTGGIFNGGPSTHTILGSFTNNGTVTSTGILNFTPSTAKTIKLLGTTFNSSGTVLFAGSGAMSVTGTPTALNNVTITNTAGVTPANNWTVGGNFVIANNAIFNAGSNSYTVAGDMESDGTLNGGTSTFTLSGASNSLTGSPGTTFYDLVITGNIAANSDFNVAHNFTNNNLFDATVGTVIFTGSLASVIGGTSSPYTLAQFTINKTSATTSLAQNTVGVADLHVQSGTFDNAGFSVTQDAGGGILTIDDNALYRVGGTTSLPTFTSYAIDTLSNVEYYGGTQAINADTSYGNLQITAAGNKTASKMLHILSNFTLSNGTFIPGSFVDTLEGSWSMTGGTFTNTGNTFVFSGTGVQNISSTGAFNNLQVKKASGNITMGTNVTVNTTLNFIKGIIQTGTFTMIIPATGSVTGASASTGWVYGKLQKNVSTGTSVTRNYEVGDGTNYSPATLLFASVTTAGNMTGTATATEHPNIATSPLNPNRSVNRYWSFTNSGTVFTTTSVTVNWVAGDVDAGSTTSNFKVANYNGSTWTSPTTVSPLATSIQATGLSSIGDIAVGELLNSNTWTGAVSTNWFLTGNWSASFVPLTTTDAIIPSALTNYPNITTGTATTHNLTIQTGASVTVNGGAMQISGTISNSGTFTATNGSIELNGSVAQTIPASTFATNTVNNLTSNNSAGITVSGTLNIAGILKVTTGTLTTGGFITLLSTATQTALIDGSGSGSVSGNVTMQRYLPSAFGYRYVSSPFQSATVSQLADDINLSASFPTLYSYVENVAYSGWTAYTTTTNALVPMAGYAANFGSSTAAVTFNMTGTVNNGTITSPTFTNNNQPYTLGFNLAGNPYPSPVDWNAAGGWTKTNIDNAIYYFNNGTTDQYAGTYSSYINGISSDGVANNIIPAMQGFFVHVSNGTFPVTATFAVNNTARVNNLTPNYHRDAPATVPLLRLAAGFTEDGSGEDMAVVYFDHSAVKEFDQTMDALKIMNTDPSVPNMFMRGTDTNRLSVYALPYLQDSTFVIPLGLYTKKTGYLTFRAADLLRMPAGWHIYLKDGEDTYQQLTADAHYRTYVNAGNDDRRFSIVFSLKALGTAPDNTTFNAYSAHGKIFVALDLEAGETEQLTVCNVSGQVLFRTTVTGSGVRELGPSFSSGIYMVSLYSKKGLRTKKVFVAHQ